MSTYDISSIIDPNVFKDFKKLQEESVKYNDTLAKIHKSTVALSEEMKKKAKTDKVLSDTQKKAAKNTKELEAAAKALNRQREAAAKKLSKQTEKELELQAALKKEAKSIEDLKLKNKALTAQRNKLDLTTEKGRRTLKNLNKQIDANNKKIKENSDNLSKQRMSVGGYTAAIKDSGVQFGVLGLAMTKLKTGFALVKAGFSSMKAAMISTGIGAFVLAIVALVQSFKDTEEGATRLEKVLIPFKILFGNLTDLVSDMGDGIYNAFADPKQAVKDLWGFIKSQIMNRLTGIGQSFVSLGKIIESAFTLDWEGVKQGSVDLAESLIQVATGVEDISDKIGNFVKETAKETAQAQKMANERLALQKKEREIMVENAKLAQQIARNRLKAEDKDTYNAKQRLEFIELAIEAEKRKALNDEAIAAKRLEFSKLEHSFSKSNAEDLTEEAELEKALIEVQTARYTKSIRLEAKRQQFLNEAKKEQILYNEVTVGGYLEDARVRLETADTIMEKDEEIFIAKRDGMAKLNELQQEYSDQEKARIRERYNLTQALFSSAMELGSVYTTLRVAQLKKEGASEEEVAKIKKDGLIFEKSMAAAQAWVSYFAAIPAINNAAAKMDAAAPGTGVAYQIAEHALQLTAAIAATAQIAAVAIPEFDKGTIFAPDLFIAGEKDTEIMNFRGKTQLIEKPTLFSGFKGAEIISSEDTAKIINNRGYDSPELMNELKGLRSDIRNKTEYYFNFKKGTISSRKGSRYTNYINRLI